MGAAADAVVFGRGDQDGRKIQTLVYHDWHYTYYLNDTHLKSRCTVFRCVTRDHSRVLAGPAGVRWALIEQLGIRQPSSRMVRRAAASNRSSGNA